MFGKSKIQLAAILFLAACGSQKYEDEVTERRLISWIDDRQYARVISFLEFEATKGERKRLTNIEAEAHMGLGGFELLSVMESVKGPMNYRRSAFKAMALGCPQKALKNKELKTLESRCLVVRLFNVLPEMDHPDLNRARDLWRSLGPTARSLMARQDQLLSATFEVSMLMARSGKILADYYDLSVHPLKTSDVDELFADIKIAADESKKWLDTSMISTAVSSRSLNRRFLGAESGALFESKILSHVEFAQKTGLPRLMAIADVENQGVEERVMRANVVKALDDVLISYFKVHF